VEPGLRIKKGMENSAVIGPKSARPRKMRGARRGGRIRFRRGGGGGGVGVGGGFGLVGGGVWGVGNKIEGGTILSQLSFHSSVIYYPQKSHYIRKI